MALEQVAGGVDHFGLDPDAEVHAALAGLGGEVIEAVREFVGVDLPIAEAGIVVVAGMAIAEPAVVQEEGVHSQILGAVEEGDDGLFVKMEIGGLPVIEQDRSGLVAVADAVAERPAMEIAADSTFAVVAPGPEHGRRGEGPAGLEAILGGRRIYAAQGAQAVFPVHFEGKLEAAGPGEGAAEHLAGILLGRGSQREDEGGDAEPAGSHSDLGVEHLDARAEFFFNEGSLSLIIALKLGEPVTRGLEQRGG